MINTLILQRIKAKINASGEQKLLSMVFALTSGRMFNLAVSFILLLIQSRFIGPEITGAVSYFFIPVGYLWILTLGIPSALARELPYYIARGQREKAIKLAETAQSFSIIMGLVCSIGFAVLSIRSIVVGNYFHALGWGIQIIIAFFAIYNSFIVTLFRTNDELIKEAKSNTISAITSIVQFPLIFINPYIGLLTKPACVAIATNGYLFIKRPLRLKLGFDLQSFIELFKFGIPIIIIGYFEANLWLSLQSTMIVTLGNTTKLGLYNFINQIMLLLLIIPNALADILRPRLATAYGASNGNIKTTIKTAAKPLILALVFSIFVVTLSWFFAGNIISLILPKYVDAIPSLEVALLLVPISTVYVIKYIFVVCKNVKYNALSTIPGFITGVTALYWFLTNGISFRFIFVPYILGEFVNLVITGLILLKISERNG